MAKRPRVFERDEVAVELLKQGVPSNSISATISFMRLVIPLAIKEVGANGIARIYKDASAEWNRAEEAGWRGSMAHDVVKWAEACLERYKMERDES